MTLPGMPTVTVFDLPACQACRATIRGMLAAGISCTVIGLDEDKEARETVRELGYAAAPVVTITDPDGEIIDHWSGYRPDEIAGLRRWLQPLLDDVSADEEQQRREDLMAG